MLLFVLSLLSLVQDTPKIKLFTYEAAPKSIVFFYEWQDSNGHHWKYNNILNLQNHDKRLRFATEATMYGSYYTPIGLYVENGKVVHKATIARKGDNSNFGMQQCIFAITWQDKAKIVPISQRNTSEYKHAVQVAPMVVVNGKINPKLTKSKSIDFRAGYGILPNGNVLFLITQDAVTFQQFAQLFVDRKCINAAYIDGGYDDFYWTPTHERHCDFGIMVGVH